MHFPKGIYKKCCIFAARKGDGLKWRKAKAPLAISPWPTKLNIIINQ